MTWAIGSVFIVLAGIGIMKMGYGFVGIIIVLIGGALLGKAMKGRHS